jgi:hypothetical protein
MAKKKTTKKTKKTPDDPVKLYYLEVWPYKDLLYWSFAPTAKLYHEEVTRTFPEIRPKPIDGDITARCDVFVVGDDYYPVIWISNYKKPWLIAHELEHFVHWFLTERKGLKYSDDSEEAYAYLIESLMETMLATRRENRYTSPKSTKEVKV